MLLDIRPDHLRMVLDILQRHVPHHAVWAFGSRAKWTAKDYSDLDLCVVSDKPLSFSILGALAEDFSESDLPWKVDVVDWATTSESFRKIIERDKVVVQEAKTGRVMAGEWYTHTLRELTINYDGKRKPVKEADRKPGPYPYYGASGIVDYVDDYLIDGDYLLIAEDGENLRTRQTPIAFMARGKSWVNNHAHIVTGNDKADTRFLMYALQAANIGAYLTGAVMPKLTQGNLNRIPICCPSPDEQRAIAHILGTLDDKIELNRRMNETLEAIARAIFKSWFVDFDPVRAKASGEAPESICRRLRLTPDLLAFFPDRLVDSELGEIPEGWEVGAFHNCCDRIESGGTPSRSVAEYWNGTIRWLTSGEVRDVIVLDTKEKITDAGLNASSAKIWPKGTTVVAMYGATAGQICLLAEEMTANQACCALIPKSEFASVVLRSVWNLSGCWRE